MDEQDKMQWTPPAGDTGVGPAGVDLLAGASAKKEPSAQPIELEQEETFLPPWMAPEIQEMDGSAASERTSEAPSPDQLKKAVGLAIADVRSVAQGQEGAHDTASILQGQNLDPKTAAVVASAMASVFSGLSETRFSAQGADPAQGGFEGYDDAEKILRNMMSGSLHRRPETVEPEPVHEDTTKVYGFSATEQAPIEVLEDDTYSPERASQSGMPRGGPQGRTANRPDVGTRQRQACGRGNAPYYGVRGRRKPQKIKIARSARSKGMRGRPNLDKTSLNLAVKVKTLSSPSRAIPIFLLTLLMIAAFSKFGVIDQYQRLASAESELSSLQRESNQIKATFPDYASVQQQYLLYDDSWLFEQEKLQVGATEVMDIIRRNLPQDKVRLVSVILTGNDLEATISGIDLNILAQLVETTKKEPLVRTLQVQHLSRTDEVPAGAVGGAPPGTFKLIIALGGPLPDPSAPDAAVPENDGQVTTIPSTVPETGVGQLPEDPEPVIPKRPVLPGEQDMGG